MDELIIFPNPIKTLKGKQSMYGTRVIGSIHPCIHQTNEQNERIIERMNTRIIELIFFPIPIKSLKSCEHENMIIWFFM